MKQCINDNIFDLILINRYSFKNGVKSTTITIKWTISHGEDPGINPRYSLPTSEPNPTPTHLQQQKDHRTSERINQKEILPQTIRKDQRNQQDHQIRFRWTQARTFLNKKSSQANQKEKTNPGRVSRTNWINRGWDSRKWGHGRVNQEKNAT